MLGLSLTKLAVLIGIIGAVLAGFRYAGRIKAFQQRMEKSREKEAAALRRQTAATKPAPAKNVDMKPCPGCGTWIPAGNATCGRAECAGA
ncbi:MAG TPA: hypothetical protein VJL84_04660 [Kiloniellales bacterium]|nr:hypothetical protein [Kiloniellales bacterium]